MLRMCCSLLKPVLFADDTTLFASGQDLNILANDVNFELLVLQDWFRATRLMVHPEKNSLYLLFFKTRECYLSDVSLYLENIILKKVPFTSFLGLVTDKNMLWKEQINLVCNKVSKATYIIIELRNL